MMNKQATTVKGLERRLDRLTATYISTAMSVDVYIRRRAAIVRQLDAKRRELVDAPLTR